MGVFGREVLTDGGADRAFRLAQDGAVTLYHRRAVLDEDVAWLASHGYAVAAADCGAWATADDVHTGLAEALALPDHYGRNLDALADCLGDLEQHTVLVLTGYDAWSATDAELAHAVLDVVAGAARRLALVGVLLLCLVQSDDADLAVTPLGAQQVGWNPAEWRTADRRT